LFAHDSARVLIAAAAIVSLPVLAPVLR